MTYIAFLRGINVGGNKKLSMAELREFLTELGFTKVQTVLQSGNVVFESEERGTQELEIFLGEEIEQRFGLATEFVVRTPSEIVSVMERNPFPDEAIQDPGHLLVLFMKSVPVPKDVELLQASIVGREVVHADGKHVYAIFPDGIGDSKLTSHLDRKLGKTWTGRNWNTVSKLAEMTKS
ncbi:MAG: DUF1697 domain-containing protein [Armatimonadota bacterium]